MAIRFTAPCPTEQLLERARRDLVAAVPFREQYAATPEVSLQEWAGSVLMPIREDFESLINGLHHPNPRTRIAALLVVRDCWPPLEELISECLRMALQDEDAAVRGTALEVLRSFCSWIDDPGNLLRSMIWATACPEHRELISKTMASNRLRAQCIRRFREEYRLLIGPVLDQMLYQPRSLEAFLNHTDPNVRYVAIYSLAAREKQSKRVAEIAEKLLVQECDPRIRKECLLAIADRYKASNNMRIGALLGAIVYDEREEEEVRFCAYQGLVEVCGFPLESLPVFRLASGGFRMPEDVDWSIVERFREKR